MENWPIREVDKLSNKTKKKPKEKKKEMAELRLV